MTVSPAPKAPLSDTVYCDVRPSSIFAGPATDHSAGPSTAPPGPCVSLIVVVTLAAVDETATAKPLVLVAPVSAIV